MSVSKEVHILRIGWTVIDKSPYEHDPKEHVYAICCRPEAAGDVISGGNAKTSEGYAALNFETASFGSFRENQIQPFA